MSTKWTLNPTIGELTKINFIWKGQILNSYEPYDQTMNHWLENSTIHSWTLARVKDDWIMPWFVQSSVTQSLKSNCYLNRFGPQFWDINVIYWLICCTFLYFTWIIRAPIAFTVYLAIQNYIKTKNVVPEPGFIIFW